MNKFKKKLDGFSPEHDTPVGLIHPYWARKPLNLVELLVGEFSRPGDLVYDPFMGSGTTLIASKKTGRNSIGSDLNPVSVMLVRSIFDSSENTEKYGALIDSASDSWKEYAIYLYELPEGKCVEREFYIVDGEYSQGKFSLIMEEAIVKTMTGNDIKGRREKYSTVSYLHSPKRKYFSKPVDFSKVAFVENTRIAVHKGVKAKDFFTKRNINFINFANSYIEDGDFTVKEKNFLRLFLSSLIPMLRLSDKKASSQWPYWRPKLNLTSRNPIVALKKRQKAFREMLNWEKGVLCDKQFTSKTYQGAASQVPSRLKGGQVDLILTDPPYADHAPYMEYSDIHWSLVAGESTKRLWGKEIVKTNAVGREKDSEEYIPRMAESIKALIRLLRDGGYFVFFYVDKNLSHWSGLKKAILNSGCFVEGVLSVPKQRRSMKTVTSPGKTLDGDLIVVCKKGQASESCDEIQDLSDILSRIKGESYFERFSEFIDMFMRSELIEFEENKIKDLSRVI